MPSNSRKEMESRIRMKKKMRSGNNFFLDSNRNKIAFWRREFLICGNPFLLGGEIKGLVWNGCSCMMNGECLDFFFWAEEG